jgi:hypothetical protein
MGKIQGKAQKPLQRTSDIVVQNYNNEILIYDLRQNKAHCLNDAAAAIWKACDGTKSTETLGQLFGGDETVWLALSELKNRDLIENADIEERLSGMSRREVIKKVGIGAMIALPIVTSLVAPQAAHAASNCGAPCTQNNDCNNPANTCRNCNGTPGNPGICVV